MPKYVEKNSFWEIVNSKIFVFAMLVVAATGPVFLWAAQMHWQWMNYGFEYYSTLVMVTMIIVCCVLTVLIIVRSLGYGGPTAPPFRIIQLIFQIGGLLLTILGFVYFLLEELANSTTGAFIGSGLIFAFAILFAVYALFFHHALKTKKLRVIVSTVLLLGIIGSMLYISFYQPPLRLNDGVTVFDAGDDMYSVTFSTNRQAVGFVQYTMTDGTTNIRFAHRDGKAHRETIHAVRIPRYRLRGATYRVGAFVTRFSDITADMHGVPPESDWIFSEKEYVFRGVPYNMEEISIFAVADHHRNNYWISGLAKNAWANPNQPDLIVMTGDNFSPSSSDHEIKAYVIYSGYLLSRGVVPVLYARGNHEVRGVGADNISARLGLRATYWRTDIGDITFTIFDNGTDWYDENPQTGGLLQHRQLRQDQMHWLNRQGAPTGRHIAINHMPWFGTLSDRELTNEWLETLKAQNVGLLIAGHTHVHYFGRGQIYAWDRRLDLPFGTGNPEFAIGGSATRAPIDFPFYTLVVGGHTNAVYGRYRDGDLIGALMVIRGNYVTATAYTHVFETVIATHEFSIMY